MGNYYRLFMVALCIWDVVGFGALPLFADDLGVEFDKSIVNFAEFHFDESTQRYSDSVGNILQIRNEKLSAEIAEKTLKNRLFQLKLLFAPNKPAYAGMLTRDESCGKNAVFAKDIVRKSNSMFWFSEMPAMKTLIYGGCGMAEEPYWSEQLLIYCKDTGQLHDIRYFRVIGAHAVKFGKPIAICRKATPQ